MLSRIEEVTGDFLMAQVISDITRDRPAPFGYSFDRIVIELARARLTVDGREVQAPTLPLRLLQALCERPGVMIPRRELFEYIWPRQIASNEALTKLIGRLRDMLGMYGARVVTVRGRGVRLDATVRRLETPPSTQEGVNEVALAAKPNEVEPRTVPLMERPIVLVVDDSPDSVLLLTETLKDKYRTKIATSGAAAIKAALRQPQPDIILMDVVMPEMDGFELCKSLKQLPNVAGTPIIFITGKIQPEEEAHGLAIGAVDYITKPISQPVVLARIATHLKLVNAQRTLLLHNEQLEDTVRQRTKELAKVQDATIAAMAALAETRDDETGNHIYRTQRYVKALAMALAHHPRFEYELTEDSIELLFKSAPLHDIGKVSVPDHILKKAGPLTEEEFEAVKQHTTKGGDAIRSVEARLGESSDFLRFAREIAYSHQEHWDGSGYPDGLAGDEIPISARLMAVADVYDALISRRCYKAPFSHETAVTMMEQGRGTHFDPDVLDSFIRIQDQFREIAKAFTDQAEAVR
jgi:putative two-component system response regulator